MKITILNDHEKRERKVAIYDEINKYKLDLNEAELNVILINRCINTLEDQYLQLNGDVTEKFTIVTPISTEEEKDQIDVVEPAAKEKEQLNNFEIQQNASINDDSNKIDVSVKKRKPRRNREEIVKTMNSYREEVTLSEQEYIKNLEDGMDNDTAMLKFSYRVIKATDGYRQKCSDFEYNTTRRELKKKLEHFNLIDLNPKDPPSDPVEIIPVISDGIEDKPEVLVERSNEQIAEELIKERDCEVEVTYNLMDENWIEELTPKQKIVLSNMSRCPEESIDDILVSGCVEETPELEEVINNCLLLVSCPDIKAFLSLGDHLSDLSVSLGKEDNVRNKELITNINVFMVHIKALLNRIAEIIFQESKTPIPF